MIFSVLFPFQLDEIKVDGDSCLPWHFANTKRKMQTSIFKTVGSSTVSHVPFTLSITFHVIFIFSHLSLFFSLLRHLIINMNHKNNFKILGLFGYYLWHYGAWDFFLHLGLETLAYLGDLVILSDYFVWSYWGLPQDIGLLIYFCVQVFYGSVVVWQRLLLWTTTILHTRWTWT